MFAASSNPGKPYPVDCVVRIADLDMKILGMIDDAQKWEGLHLNVAMQAREVATRFLHGTLVSPTIRDLLPTRESSLPAMHPVRAKFHIMGTTGRFALEDIDVSLGDKQSRAPPRP